MNKLQQSLLCNDKHCKHCLYCIGQNPFSGKDYICEKFGDRTEHGLILAKFCDMFLCDVMDKEYCSKCRGFLGQYEEEE